eukprot:3941049-Rhodomonas_salina.1
MGSTSCIISEELEINLEYLKELRKVRKAEQEEEAAKKAKPVCAGAAAGGGAAKHPGVCAAGACKATAPKPNPAQLKVPVKPATTVVSLVAPKTPAPAPTAKALPVPADTPAATSSAAIEKALECEKLQRLLDKQEAEQKNLELQIRLQQQQQQSAALRAQLKRDQEPQPKEFVRDVKQHIEGGKRRGYKDLVAKATAEGTLANLEVYASDQPEDDDSDQGYSDAKTPPSPSDPNLQVPPKGSLLEGVFSAEDLA